MVLEVPADRLFDPLLELQAGLPAQLALEFARVDGVAQVVSRAVGDVGDQLLRSPLGASQQAVHGPDDHPDQVDVPPLVEPADVVCFAVAPLVEDEVDGPGVVLDVEPVADILAPAVDRQRFVVADVVYKQRYEFFGELVRPVVVRTVGHHGRESVRVVERPHEMVRRGFRCRVGRVGVVAGLLGEERSVEGQRPVNFVGRDVVEASALPCAVPVLPCGLQQRQRPHHVGPREGERIADRAVDVAFGREVDHPVDVVSGEQRAHGLVVADVAFDERVVRTVLDVPQVREIAGVGQAVEVYDPVVGVFPDEQPHDVRADESGAAGDQDIAFHVRLFCCFSRFLAARFFLRRQRYALKAYFNARRMRWPPIICRLRRQSGSSQLPAQ